MNAEWLDDSCAIAEKFVNAHRNSNLLFRYRDSSRKNIKALQDDRLYFSKPKHFNDPIDSLFFVDKKEFLTKVEYEITARMADYVEQEIKSDDILILPENQFILKDNKKQFLEALFNLSRDPQSRKYFIDNYALPMLERGVALAQRNLKVICFSEDPLSSVMWSHYANNHSGFVIAYEKQLLMDARSCNEKGCFINEQELLLKKIIYSDRVRDLGAFMYYYLPTRNDLNVARKALISNTYTLSQDEIYESLTTKMPDWAYEKEWRLIPKKDDLLAEDHLVFISAKPAAIFIGVKTPIEQKKKLLQIAHKNEIPAFGMFINTYEHRFTLDCSLL